MQTATTDVLYFETGPDNQPTLRVSPGEEFEVRTQINRGPWLDEHPDREALLTKLHGGNPSSGCIYVDGAEPGQDLIVHIGEIEVDPVGFTNYGGSTGAMPGWLGDSGVGRHHKVVRIEDGQILWSERLKIPIAPMLGFVGVAPKNTRWLGPPADRRARRAAAHRRHARASGRRGDMWRGWHRGRRAGEDSVRAGTACRVHGLAADNQRHPHHWRLAWRARPRTRSGWRCQR